MEGGATSTPEHTGLEFKIILANVRRGLKNQDANELLSSINIRIREEQQLHDCKPATTEPGGRSAEKDRRVGVDQQLDVNQQGCAENSKQHAEACKEHHHV